MGEHAFITPSVLTWARERAGYSVEEAAAKLKVKPSHVHAWESGDAPVTLGRLEDIARLYKRPSALFYLPRPPAEEERRPPDYRDKPSGRVSPELIYQIRYAQERREVALDLYSEVGEKPPRFSFTCTRDQHPADVGAKLRTLLGISPDIQRQWSADYSGYSAMNGWKDAAQKSGVLVFQASRRDMSGARGFSVHESILPIVMLTSEEVPVARAFTLLHELAHIALHQGGICDLHDRDVELYCNKVAAAALMPSSQLLKEVRALGNPAPDAWPDSSLRKLARLFSVSEQALVLRLVELGAASWQFYQEKRPEFDLRSRQAKVREDKESGSFVPPHVQSMARNGTAFTRLVLEAYHRRIITSHHASSYLNVSFDSLGKIEQEMSRRLMRAS